MTGTAVGNRNGSIVSRWVLLFRVLSVAVDAPAHIELRMNFYFVHGGYIAMALCAIKSASNMSFVAETGMVRKIMNFVPAKRYAHGIGSSQILNVRTV